MLKSSISLETAIEFSKRCNVGFPAYSGIKGSFVFEKGHAKAVRLHTTGEVARLLKLHKMVLLRWIAKGEIRHPAHYCFQRGICLLWDDRDLKAIRSFAKWKKRKRLPPYSRS